MSPNIAALLYLASGVLFILALRGLSSPESSRRGNMFGMAGMTIAVLTTLGQLDTLGSPLTWVLILAGLGIGGGIGAYIARSIPMTMMPELVAAFHSLVGLAGGVRGSRRALRAGGLRYRHARQYRRRQPAGDVARRRHRRYHVHRLGDRLRQAVRAHVRQADHSARATSHQYRPGRC